MYAGRCSGTMGGRRSNYDAVALIVCLMLVAEVPVGAHQVTDHLVCEPEQCAHITCPADSRSIYEQPTASLNLLAEPNTSEHIPFALYIDPHHLDTTTTTTTTNQTTHQQSPNDAPISPSNSAVRLRRSMRPFKRRDPIKIVPGDHHIIHKRSPAAIELTLAELEQCCIQTVCKCDTECAQTTCPAGETPVLVSESSIPRPGHCCPEYHCRRTDEMAKHACYSFNHRMQFQHGETWAEDECSQCECNDGLPKCTTSMCKPLTCGRTIRVKGECCPKCDYKDSQFCAGHEECDRGCKYGFQQSQEGCMLCKCVRKKVNHTSTTTTTTESSPSSTTDDSMDELIIASSPSSSDSPLASASTTTTTTSTTTMPPPPSWNPFDLETDISSPTVDTETDPTIMSIRSYFQEHHLYIIVSITVFVTSVLFAALVWTYCKFNNKNSYNIVPNA